MGRVSDVMIDIAEHLDPEKTDKEIAEAVGCPESWVRDAREQQFYEDHVAPFEDENWYNE